MVTSKYVGGVLIVILCVVLGMPARADTLKTDSHDIEIGIGAVIAGVVVVTILAIHYSKKRTITGCVISGTNGMSVTDEKDRRSYTLSGNTTGIKLGDRMKLQGKKIKPKDAGNSFVWETKEVAKDFGGCQP
jgi:hypothetical protein